MSATLPSPHRRSLPRSLTLGLTLTVACTAWLALQPAEEAAQPERAGRNAVPVIALSPGSKAIDGQSARRSQEAAAVEWPAAPAQRALPWPTPSSAALLAWSTPPPAVALVAATAPEAPPAPVAPPFPYTLIGYFDDGQPRALLMGPMNTIAAKAGDVVDGQWRVDDVQPRMVSATWLPGGQQKTLSD